MNYLLAPLHTHFDLGFGATGNAFKEAADYLESSAEFKSDGLFSRYLPINFLYRHGVELHLKSGIVIFHRRFKLAYGEFGWDAEPRVLVGGNWKLSKEVHGIQPLWTYFRQLLADHAEWLSANTKCDWSIDPDADTWVQIVQEGDPRSTFFRYPSTDNLAEDAPKSTMKELFGGDLIEALKNAKAKGDHLKALATQNAANEWGKVFVHDDVADAPFRDALCKLASYCYNLHAAMRWELCAGW